MRRVIVALVLFVSAVFGGDGYLFSVESNPKVTTKTIEKAFENGGFFISDNRDMNKPYTIQFGKTNFDIYNLFTLYNKELAPKIVAKYEDYGLFVPQSIVMYQKKGDKKFYLAFLKASAVKKITGIGEEPMIDEIEKKMLEIVKTAMPGAKEEKFNTTISAPQGSLISKFTMDIDAAAWEDVKMETQMVFEGELKPKGFTMASFTDFNFEMSKLGDSGYSFYDTYSICKLKVIYNVAKTNPEAGIFAPCSMAMYTKKDSGKLVLEFPSVYNWISSLNISSKEGVDELIAAQKDMEKILKALTE